MENVRIEILSGGYMQRYYEGSLSDAPVAVFIPEGIITSNTYSKGNALRERIVYLVANYDSIVINVGTWSLKCSLLKSG